MSKIRWLRLKFQGRDMMSERQKAMERIVETAAKEEPVFLLDYAGGVAVLGRTTARGLNHRPTKPKKRNKKR